MRCTRTLGSLVLTIAAMQGLFYVSGHGSRLVVQDDGTEVLTLGRHGSAENLCGPLGDA